MTHTTGTYLRGPPHLMLDSYPKSPFLLDGLPTIEDSKLHAPYLAGSESQRVIGSVCFSRPHYGFGSVSK